MDILKFPADVILHVLKFVPDKDKLEKFCEIPEMFEYLRWKTAWFSEDYYYYFMVLKVFAKPAGGWYVDKDDYAKRCFVSADDLKLTFVFTSMHVGTYSMPVCKDLIARQCCTRDLVESLIDFEKRYRKLECYAEIISFDWFSFAPFFHVDTRNGELVITSCRNVAPIRLVGKEVEDEDDWEYENEEKKYVFAPSAFLYDPDKLTVYKKTKVKYNTLSYLGENLERFDDKDIENEILSNECGRIVFSRIGKKFTRFGRPNQRIYQYDGVDLRVNNKRIF